MFPNPSDAAPTAAPSTATTAPGKDTRRPAGEFTPRGTGRGGLLGDGRWSTQPTPDWQRVLGQIARGEVVAGPEGARRIAARHEAAYGGVWSKPITSIGDAAWADAVASLLGPTGGA